MFWREIETSNWEMYGCADRGNRKYTEKGNRRDDGVK